MNDPFGQILRQAFPTLHPKFEKTYCSQCGGEFGPGDSGFSHCDQHRKPTMDKAVRKLIHQLGAACILASDELEDEGDRVYLGSTNHGEALKKAAELYDEWRQQSGDLGEDIGIPG